MYNVGDIVKLKGGYVGEIVNKNEFREPSMKYAVDTDGFEDVLFIGDDVIIEKVN
jgi:hypothetical protein